MENIRYYIDIAISFVEKQFRMLYWTDAVDILLLSLLIYGVFRFARDRRAGRLLIGIFTIFIVYGLSSLFNFNSVAYILRYLVVEAGILVFVVLFQPELRTLLERLGDEPLRGIKNIGSSKNVVTLSESVDSICEAVSDMARSRTGALIVIERAVKLGDIVKSGVEVDAKISSYLLRNIFFNKSPLHDGAVVIRDMRVLAAGCFLPLSDESNVDMDLGTRHRAALGMSEASDAIVVVVSEETGKMSVAIGGSLTRDYNYQTLKHTLLRMLANNSTAEE